jgi:hypothetical protein
MSLIRLHRQPKYTELDIRKAQDAIDRWVAIRKLMSSDGWHYLSEDIKKEAGRLDSIKGLTPGDLLGRTERLEGTEFPFRRIRDYEQAASEGEKIIAFVTAQNKE